MTIGKNADRLLHLIRDHPWADAWQLSRLSGLGLRTVYRSLEELIHEGMVWSLRVGVPDVRGRLYVPGYKGLIHLAGGARMAGPYARAFGLDPLGLGRSLLHVRALGWTRNFLCSLLEYRQHLEWVVTPARVQAGARTLVLDGHGVVVPRPGCGITFGVLADIGGITVESWAEPVRLFMGWAEKHVAERYMPPALVILTTHTARAVQFVALWQEVAEARRIAARKAEEHALQHVPHTPQTRMPEPRRMPYETPAHLFVAAVHDLALGGMRQWMNANGQKCYLWEGMRGDLRPFPRPWPRIEPEKRRLWGGSPGACVLHSTLGGNQVLHAFRELAGGDWELLEAIAGWPLLRPAELAVLLNRHAAQVGRALKHLLALGLVEKTCLHEREERLYLSPIGIRLLAATHGLPARRFGRARHWPIGQHGPVQLHLGAYSYAVEHTLLTVWFIIGLRRLADWWQQAGYSHQLVIWDSIECVRSYIDGQGRRRRLRPDSGGVYRIGHRSYSFLLEIDRGRGHRGYIVLKFQQYYECRRHPGPLEMGAMPRVLIVCSGEGRARLINEVLVDLAHRRDEPVLDAMITTLEQVYFPGRFDECDGHVERVEPGGVGRPVEPQMWPGLRVWRPAGDGFNRPTWCFEALKAPCREGFDPSMTLFRETGFAPDDHSPR